MTSPSDIAEKLATARAAYYIGKPIMDDAAYDALEDKLKRVDPDNPLLKQLGDVPDSNTLKKVNHRTFMGSLENSFDEDSITTWVERVQSQCVSADKLTAILEPKMDGSSIELRYDRGVFVYASTRGDGDIGEDVSAAVLAAGIPRTLPVEVDIDVRCEAMLTKKAFTTHFATQGYANPRNAAAGTVRSLDVSMAKYLRLYAFSAEVYADRSSDTYRRYATEESTLDTLASWGFRVVRYEVVPFNTAALIAAWKNALADRADLPYDVDGLVVKLNHRSLQDALGKTATCPIGCRALKWRGQMVATSKVVGLDNSVGRSGVITPVVSIEPVNCGGVTVTRASLMNWDEIERIENGSNNGFLGIGARITIERAGDVIPRVIAVESSCPAGKRFTRPEVCPSCGEPTTIDGPRQVCTNAECPAQTFRKILRWIDGRNILNFGESTLDTLMAVGSSVRTIADIYKINEAAMAKATGSVITAKKILAALEASKECTLVELLGNIGIPSIGETEAAKVVAHIKAKTVSDVFAARVGEVKKAIGPVRGEKFVAGLNKYADLLVELNTILTVTAPKSKAVNGGTAAWNGKTFCITGATSLPRAAFVKMIEEAGGVWKSSVVKGLDYLITSDPDSGSKKNKDAVAKGVTVISETTAVKMADG